MRNIIIIGFIIVAMQLSACSWVPDLSDIGLPKVHKVDVPQGNVIEQDQINQLRPGMSKEQVIFVMGTPMINDSFHDNRWDYIFRFKPGYGDLETKRTTVFFNDNDKLVNIIGDYRPGDKADKVHTTTEIVVVPLEGFDGVSEDGEKSYWRRFIDFFAWTDEHRGIPEERDVPVNRREADSYDLEKSPQTSGE